MVVSKPICVLWVDDRKCKVFQSPIRFGLTCDMACVVRAVYFISFIVVAFPVFSYSSHQLQGDPQCNILSRKDSNSNFFSFPLSVCSLLLPAVTKAFRVGTEMVSCFFLRSSVSLFERIQGHITGFAVTVLKTNTWIRDRLDSSDLQIFACAKGSCPPDNCSVFGLNFIRSRGSLCTNTSTLIHLSHCSEYKPDPQNNISLLNTAATKPLLEFHKCLGTTLIPKRVWNLWPPLLFKDWN